MKIAPIERIASFTLTTLIHVAAGLALILSLSPGGGRHGATRQGRDGVLVAELIPLDHGAAESAPVAAEIPAPLLPAERTAEPQPALAVKAPGNAQQADAAPPTLSGSPAPAAQPGAASSDLAGTSALVYRDLLLAHIARFRQYPAEAHRDRLEGSVMVRFILHRDGSVEQCWVVSSSGRPVFDREALAAIRRADPLPAIPTDLPATIDISLPIDFKIG